MDLKNEPRGHAARNTHTHAKQKLQTLVDTDPHQTLRDMAEQLAVHFHVFGKVKIWTNGFLMSSLNKTWIVD